MDDRPVHGLQPKNTIRNRGDARRRYPVVWVGQEPIFTAGGLCPSDSASRWRGIGIRRVVEPFFANLVN